MTETGRRYPQKRVLVDLAATIFGIVSIGIYAHSSEEVALFIGVYGFLFGTSTAIVTYCLTQFTGISIETDRDSAGDRESSGNESASLSVRAWRIFTGTALVRDSDGEEDTGWLIGRLENVIVLTLVLVGEYTALSIVFAAKSWVRREDTASEDTTYYLAGTMVNFTYSIVVGICLPWLLDSL